MRGTADVKMDVGRAVEEGRPQMGAGGEGPGLSEALSSYWTARDRFLEAGLRMNRSDPAGGLAEALIAAVLWPLHDVQDAYVACRDARLGQDASGQVRADAGVYASDMERQAERSGR